MKKFSTLFLITLLTGSLSAQFSFQNVTLLSNWMNPSTPAEPTYGIKYNGIWGWVDPQDNKEYAIIGSSDGVYFIDVSIPTAPVVRDFVAGRRNMCIWREIKTYQNYCYMVSDDAPPNSLQIVDLSYLPDSVNVVYDDNTIIDRSHTIFIDGNKLYCGIPKGPAVGGASKLAVFSLANPINPTLLRKIEQDDPNADNCHDMFVRNDTVYASMSFTGLFVYKFNTSNNTFVPITTLTNYPGQGYNHSSSLTPDGNTLIMLDEVPTNLPCKSVDVSNLPNISVLQTFRSTTNTIATPHNPFVVDNNRVVISYYQDGVQIFDISNPSNVVRTGYFDTNPTDGSGLPNPNYSGCWGAYVELPSGIIIASDMQLGLFVLDADNALLGNKDPELNLTNAVLYPNPAVNTTTLSFNIKKETLLTYEINDMTGRNLAKKTINLSEGNHSIDLDVSKFAKGLYFVSLNGKGIKLRKKLVLN